MRRSCPTVVLLVQVLALAVAACASDDPPAGAGADASATADVGDAAAASPDAAPADAATPDAVGDAPDATTSSPDAGDLDADGPAGDADPATDGGSAPRDATPSDGAVGADADPFDGGSTFDATFAVDVGPRGQDAAPGVDRGPPGDGGPNGADAGNLCTSNADCVPGVEVCGRLVVENNSVVSRCGQPKASTTAQSVGGMCTGDGDCASNLCLDGLANECSQICRGGTGTVDCPAGFTCAAYQYTPGNVWIPSCGRSCADDDDCSGTAGNVCSTTSFPTPAGPYDLAQVCQVAAGTVALGGTCATADDCRSGICFRNTRVGVGCAACGAGEACGCPGGGAPPCAGGVMPDCVLRACTALCDDATDCAAGGPLTRCAPGVNLRLPDGQTRPISACSRP